MFSVIQIEYNGADGRSVSGYENPALILSATRQAIAFPESFLRYKWKSPGSNNPLQDTRIITAIADKILFIMNMMKNDRYGD